MSYDARVNQTTVLYDTQLKSNSATRIPDDTSNDSVFADYYNSNNRLDIKSINYNYLSDINYNDLSKEDKLIYVKASYQYAKDEQGILGKVSNGFKNLFNTKNSPKNIEKAIATLDENSSEEEIDALMDRIKKYDSNQDAVVKTTATTGAMLAGGAVGAKAGAAVGTAVFPGFGTAVGVAVGAVAGAITGVIVNQIENITDKIKGNSWHNDENVLKEAGEGALSGGSAVAIGALSKAVKSVVAAKLGLKTVEAGGKTIFAALGEDGTAKIGETVAKNALAGGIAGGTSAAAVSDSIYLIDVATDKDKGFSLQDFATTTSISFLLAGTVGAAADGLGAYKGVKMYNQNLKDLRIIEAKQERQRLLELERQRELEEQRIFEERNREFDAIQEQRLNDFDNDIIRANSEEERQVIAQNRKAWKQFLENEFGNDQESIDSIKKQVTEGYYDDNLFDRKPIITENPTSDDLDSDKFVMIHKSIGHTHGFNGIVCDDSGYPYMSNDVNMVYSIGTNREAHLPHSLYNYKFDIRPLTPEEYAEFTRPKTHFSSVDSSTASKPKVSTHSSYSGSKSLFTEEEARELLQLMLRSQE